MKEEILKIKKELHEPDVKSSENDELEKAIERIHKRYGNNLEAFFQDVKDSIHKQNAKTEKGQLSVL